MPEQQPMLLPEVKEIISVLRSDCDQNVVVLVVPSHDKKKKPLPDQPEWANAGLRLFGKLYRGATAFDTFAGIYRTDQGEYLEDKPILIEAYASNGAIEDEANLGELVAFAKRMGKETRQVSVMLAFGNVMFYVEDFGAE